MSKAKVGKVLAICADYNGYKNVLFMMKSDDCRLAPGEEKWGYRVLEKATFNFKEKIMTTQSGKRYTVFSDWSVKEIVEVK